MSKLNLVEDDIATINIETKRELSPIQEKLIQSLAFIQMMCVTAADDEPEKLYSLINILSETVDKSNALFKEQERFDVTAQF